MNSISPETESQQASKVQTSLAWKSIVVGSLVSVILYYFFFTPTFLQAGKGAGEDLSDYYPTAVGLASILSPFIGGMVAGGIAKHRQALLGLLAGLLFQSIYAISQILFFNGTISILFLFPTAIVVLLGLLGGWIAKLIVPSLIRFNATRIVSVLSASITLVSLLFPWAKGFDLIDRIPSTASTISGYEFVFRQSALKRRKVVSADSVFVKTTAIEGVQVGSDPTLWLYKAIPTVAVVCLLLVFTKLGKLSKFIRTPAMLLLSAIGLGGIALLISKLQFGEKPLVTLAGYGYSLSNLEFGFWVTAVGILGIVAAEAMNLCKSVKENPLNNNVS